MTYQPRVLTLLALVGIAVTTAPRPIDAQAVVGRVIDHVAGEPLSDVFIRLADSDGVDHATTYSNYDGRFRLAAPGPGDWQIVAEHVGYGQAESHLITLAADQTTTVEIRMAVKPVVLDEPIVITAERSYINADIAGFHRRRLDGGSSGSFVYGEEIRRRLGARPTDLLRGIPGLTMLRTPRGQDQIIHMRNGCIPAVFIDGMQINRHKPTVSIDTYVDVQSIEGIEVYRGQQMGGRFFDRHGCGTVLVWTRRGEVEPTGSFSLGRLFVAVGILTAMILTMR